MEQEKQEETSNFDLPNFELDMSFGSEDFGINPICEI